VEVEVEVKGEFDDHSRNPIRVMKTWERSMPNLLNGEVEVEPIELKVEVEVEVEVEVKGELNGEVEVEPIELKVEVEVEVGEITTWERSMVAKVVEMVTASETEVLFEVLFEVVGEVVKVMVKVLLVVEVVEVVETKGSPVRTVRWCKIVLLNCKAR